jgi:hypothetical protein
MLKQISLRLIQYLPLSLAIYLTFEIPQLYPNHPLNFIVYLWSFENTVITTIWAGLVEDNIKKKKDLAILKKSLKENTDES